MPEWHRPLTLPTQPVYYIFSKACCAWTHPLSEATVTAAKSWRTESAHVQDACLESFPELIHNRPCSVVAYRPRLRSEAHPGQVPQQPRRPSREVQLSMKKVSRIPRVGLLTAKSPISWNVELEGYE